MSDDHIQMSEYRLLVAEDCVSDRCGKVCCLCSLEKKCGALLCGVSWDV